MLQVLLQFLRDSAWGGISGILALLGFIGAIWPGTQNQQSNSSNTAPPSGTSTPLIHTRGRRSIVVRRSIAIIVVIISIISSFLSFISFRDSETGTARPPSAPPSTLLCQANESNGWNGWIGSHDWNVNVQNGQLLNDGSDESLDARPTIMAPCQAIKTADWVLCAAVRRRSSL